MRIQLPPKDVFGTLTADKIVCPEIDTVAANLVLKRAGVPYLSLGVAFLETSKHLKLGTGLHLKDASSDSILGTDNLGHFTTFGRIDTKVTMPANSLHVLCKPVELAPINQSGTFDETFGSWSCVADDSLWLYLDTVFGWKHLLASVRIDTVIVNGRSGHNDDYLTLFQLVNNEHDADVQNVLLNDPTDYGLGSTIPFVATYTPDVTLLDDFSYQICIGTTVPNTSVTIHSIEILYSLV